MALRSSRATLPIDEFDFEVDEETVRRQHEGIRRALEALPELHAEILAERGGKPFTREEIDELIAAVRENRD